jgi:hypothetical protein
MIGVEPDYYVGREGEMGRRPALDEASYHLGIYTIVSSIGQNSGEYRSP